MVEVNAIPAPDREAQLLSTLDREPFIIVLDGLERLLIAYARMDAAHMDDLGPWASSPTALGSEGSDSTSISSSRGAKSAEAAGGDARAPREEHRLRKTADPRAGAFLRKLAMVRTARILISTRLFAADLENRVNGEPLPGCVRRDLHGLADDDALELWRSFGVTGARDTLLPIFDRVENHPLLIQALAAEVSRFRPAPGDFDEWRQTHPDFDPFRDVPLVQVKSHVLGFALRGLDDKNREALRIISAFRMPASYDTLTALLIGEAKPCTDVRELDTVLAELEDRGLVGWDKRANRYDLHPIVRGVVWGGVSDEARRDVYTNLHAHFEALPMIGDSTKVNRLDDLTPAIELFNTLVGLMRFDDALMLIYQRVGDPMLYHLSANRQLAELLELLFPDGPHQLPKLRDPYAQGLTLNTLAMAYINMGSPDELHRCFAVHTVLPRQCIVTMPSPLSWLICQTPCGCPAHCATRSQ